MVVVAHASNVTGTILPIAEIAKIAHLAGAWLLVDAAQTAGVLPIDIQSMGIDLLAFTGHKGLLGPPGTGGLLIGDRIHTEEIQPLVRGGTGSRSEFETQPEDCPDKFESGTLNGPGIAGLGVGVRWVKKQGVAAIREREIELTQALMEGLRNIRGVTVHGPADCKNRAAIISFTASNHRVSDIGFRLDEELDILARVGLHCAPAAHRAIGTFPEGTVRFALGAQTTMGEVAAAIAAVARILEQKKHA